MVLARSLSNPTPTPLSRALAAYRRLDLTKPPISRTTAWRQIKRAKHLNAVQLTRLVDRYQAGATVYELAAEFAIDRRTVSIHLKQQGVETRHHLLTDDQIHAACNLYATGLTLDQVGARLGVSGDTVRKAIHDAGVPIRSRGRQGRQQP